jgi:hypothetical protein
MEAYRREIEIMKRKTLVTSNIFRAAITDLKLGAAARHFETLITFLACCSVDVGNIGHGRNKFNKVLYCLEKIVNRRINTWYFFDVIASSHLGYRGQGDTIPNQAVLVVGRNKTGTPCPIPADAPVVYNQFEQALYGILAKILVDAIENNFSKEVLL